MASIRSVLVLFLLAVSGVASADQPAAQRPRDGAKAGLQQTTPQGQSLGYDAHGRLVPQPRLAVNLFPLADDAPGPAKEELRAFGRWLAEVARMMADLGAGSSVDSATVAELAKRTTKQPAGASSNLEPLLEKARQADAILARLKQLKPPKAAHPDLARAYRDIAKDAASLVGVFEKSRAATKAIIDAGLSKDLPAARDALIVQADAAIVAIHWAVVSTEHQVSAAVGGTPDLWLWRSQIESAQAMETMFGDLRHLLVQGTMPAPIGRLNIQENVTSMSEWIRRGEIQVRHELNRAQTSLDVSATRSRWLEAIYRNYERSFQMERAIQAWLAKNVPALYAGLAPASATERTQAQVGIWPQLGELSQQEWRLMVERCELLATMP